MSSSPFLARLNSNYSAEETDIPQLEAIIAQSATELESIRLEMERTRKVYMDLADQHECLLGYIEAHRALLAPVRRLPVEVLQEIFLHCLPEADREAVVDSKYAPILLTHICGSWRQIAIATPFLWSSIHIVLPRPKLPRLDTQGQTKMHNWTLRAVTEWLSRSASLPLNISVLDPDTRFSVTDPLSEKIIRLVLSCCHRWRSLSLNISARFLDKHFVSLPASRLPLLRDLTIREAYTPWRGEAAGDMRPGAPWRSAGITRAPTLSSISMWYSSADLEKEVFTQLPLRWSLLTSIDLHVSDPFNATPDISSLALISTLSQCTSLLMCSLQSRAHRSWALQDNLQAYSGPKVLLPRLEHLRLEGIAEDFGPLMEELETPALRTLELLVQPSKDTNIRYRLAVTSFLEECGPNLRALTIAPMTMLSTPFLKLLEGLWNLQTLHLLGRGWTPSFDNVITTIHPPGTRRDGLTIDDCIFNLRPGKFWEHQSERAVLLPNLEVFKCNLSGEGDVSDADLVGFVMARRPNPTRNNRHLVPPRCAALREMTVELNRAKDVSWTILQSLLEPYASDGCKITIDYLDPEGSAAKSKKGNGRT